MAWNQFWRPLPSVVSVCCEYNHIPYRFRQKMTLIQSYMIEVRNMSKNDYKLYLFDDGCAILDPLKNKLLCYYNYDTPMVLFLNRLDKLWFYWRYEKSIIKCKNPSEVNYYLTQKRKFYE